MAEPPTAPLDPAAAGARDELLATKVNLPRTRPDRLARSRLVQRLGEGVGRPLVLVCTPAGFGKTTLLADWAADATLPVGWLSLDPDDNEPMRFWRYVVAALAREARGLGERLDPLLSPGSGTSTHGVVTALINRLQAQPDELALVLDDYHLIDEPAIHDSLGFLLSHLPPRLHLVIATRSDPPLPVAPCGPAANWPSYAPPTCASPPRRRRPSCARCGGSTCRQRPSPPSRPAPKAGRWGCSWPPCHCRGDPTPTRSWTPS